MSCQHNILVLIVWFSSTSLQEKLWFLYCIQMWKKFEICVWNIKKICILPFSCGSKNFVNDSDFEPFQYVCIKHSETQEKRIYLPKEIVEVGRGDMEITSVPSLLELSMREVHPNMMAGKSYHTLYCLFVLHLLFLKILYCKRYKFILNF